MKWPGQTAQNDGLSHSAQAHGFAVGFFAALGGIHEGEDLQRLFRGDGGFPVWKNFTISFSSGPYPACMDLSLCTILSWAGRLPRLEIRAGDWRVRYRSVRPSSGRHLVRIGRGHTGDFLAAGAHQGE